MSVRAFSEMNFYSALRWINPAESNARKIVNSSLVLIGTFWLYAGICVLGLMFIRFKLPETKGKTLEQIERQLVD